MPVTTGSTQRVAAVIVNPTKIDSDRLHSVVGTAAEVAGWGASRWYETTPEDSGAEAARRAMADGADVVLAAGGDGTIRAVAEGLQGSGVPLALLPSGTGNLLARNLHLSLDRIEQSVDAAFSGVDRKIDLGIAEMEFPDGTRASHVFVVMAGIGLDARMIANTDPALKKRVGWLAYVQGIAVSLRGGNNLRLRFRLNDGAAHQLRVNTLLIGNCGLLTGNILLLPEAAVDDGVFDIVALRPNGILGWIQIGFKVIWENGVLRRSAVGRRLLGFTKEVHTVRYMKGAQIVVRPESPQHFQLDGDAFGEVVAVRARIDPLALTVRIPGTESGRLPASDTAKEQQTV
ncbi:diacylglycerol/lipid kinase family protein [uncultured Amnibacterium sp.]|uniref:diacylglycerol/lipid kinase family protein n=1 Tax=uncultured Amnibacterium sp. TaxID=1631851 RepID=UPI0035CACB41